MTRNILEIVDGLKHELDPLRPLPPDVIARIAQKIRLEFNYHSNAIEGNTLTLRETRNLILHGLTAHGKPMRDHLDIEGHDDAVKAMEEAVRVKEALNGVFIRNLHAVLLKEPYEMDALTPDGRLTKRLIAVDRYKTAPNNVAIFKQSMVGRARSRTSVGGRRYVEDVVLPLEQYCKDKLNLLVPDVFPSVIETGGAMVSGTGSDGKAFSLSRVLGRPDTSSVPDDVVHMQVSLQFMFSDCFVAGKTASFNIDMTGTFSANESIWEFAAERWGDSRRRSYKKKHNDHDLEDLKKQVDDTIRWIMEDLAQLAASSAGGAQTTVAFGDAEAGGTGMASEQRGRNGKLRSRLRRGMRRLSG